MRGTIPSMSAISSAEKSTKKSAARSWKFMRRNSPPIQLRSASVYDIAKAHGGEQKDKLSNMLRTDDVASQTVRPQMLAALLKLPTNLLKIQNVPRAIRQSTICSRRASEIYHEYALALQNVSIDKKTREVRFKFDIPRSKALRTFSKSSHNGEQDIYLLDEILARTLKTHCERLYCSRPDSCVPL